MLGLLSYEIIKLQNNYKAVLIEIENNIFKKDTKAILDEINVFWHRNKKIVQCALKYLARPYRTFVFTAATILDIADNEHYPFLCFGDYHIWDDPIYRYISMATKSTDEKFNSELQKQIHATIKDNIDILDKVNDEIIILPIRILSDIDNEVIHNATDHAFFSLFKVPPKTMQEYLESFNTIDDIALGLCEGIENMIILYEDDNSTIELQQRFNEYKTSTPLPLPKGVSDAFIFAFTIYGYLAQALDIILTCTAYQFVPYVRFDVAFRYLLILSSNLPDVPDIESWLFNCTIAHILHNSFDKEKYSVIEFNEFVRKIRESEFEQKVFVALQEKQISIENPLVEETIGIINAQLSACLKER